jgi:hypothetical protein
LSGVKRTDFSKQFGHEVPGPGSYIDAQVNSAFNPSRKVNALNFSTSAERDTGIFVTRNQQSPFKNSTHI